MSKPQLPVKRRLGLDDIEQLDKAAKDFAHRTGAPMTVPSPEREGEGATITPLKPPRPPSRRIHIDTPVTTILKLKERANLEDTTMTYIVLTALRAIGIEVKDQDLTYYRRVPK